MSEPTGRAVVPRDHHGAALLILVPFVTSKRDQGMYCILLQEWLRLSPGQVYGTMQLTHEMLLFATASAGRRIHGLEQAPHYKG